MEDIVDSSSTLVATEDSGNFIDIVSGKVVTMEKIDQKVEKLYGCYLYTSRIWYQTVNFKPC